uniref:Lipase domain-containing protein n=1 Tax=Bursaphelenchus xylophilus TaxID=6326 RepID=A0A1I7SE01_BURXY
MLCKSLCFFLLITTAAATISDGFYQHILENFGKEIAEIVARRDVGEKGSFGGGESVGPIRQNKIPIVFAHGQTRLAGNLNYILTNFLDNGYTFDELYATTYGTNVTLENHLSDELHCHYVKGLRWMLEAVASYTQHRQVDVIGFSFGAGLARKAILGGRCVDTKEDLGGPLTHKIRNYISVVGAQRGLAKCDKLKEYAPVCNEINGLFCNSDFNRDINDHRSGYEATHRIVAIESTDDDILAPVTSCRENAALFPGVNELYTASFYGSRSLQLSSSCTVLIIERPRGSWAK